MPRILARKKVGLNLDKIQTGDTNNQTVNKKTYITAIFNFNDKELVDFIQKRPITPNNAQKCPRCNPIIEKSKALTKNKCLTAILN